MLAGGVSYTPLQEDYAVNNLEDANPLYTGKVKANGTWLLQRYGTVSGIMGWANLSNNPSITTYAAAWAGRAALTYGEYQTLTGV